MVFTLQADYIEAPGFGNKEQDAVMPLDHIMGLPDEITNGMRAATLVIASGEIKYQSHSQYSIAADTKLEVLQSFALFQREDGRPMIMISALDMSRVKMKGIFVIAEYLPLKDSRNNYKKESNLSFVETKHIKQFTKQPVWKVPDLEGYVKSLDFFKDLGIKKLADFEAFKKLNFPESLERAKDAAFSRIDRFLTQNAPRQETLRDDILVERRDRVQNYHDRYLRHAAPLQKSFTDRFQVRVDPRVSPRRGGTSVSRAEGSSSMSAAQLKQARAAASLLP